MLSGKQARGQGSEGGDGGQRGAAWADKHCLTRTKNEADTVSTETSIKDETGGPEKRKGTGNYN